MHPRPEQAEGVPPVFRPSADDLGSVGPYTAAVLASILGVQLREIAAVTGLPVPVNRMSKKERNDLRVFFTAALEIAMIRDGKGKLLC